MPFRLEELQWKTQGVGATKHPEPRAAQTGNCRLLCSGLGTCQQSQQGVLTSVLVFLGALVSSPSLSEISSVRPCLLLLGVQDSSNRPFCKETKTTRRWRVMGKSSNPTGLHRLLQVRHSHHGTCVNDTSRPTWTQHMEKMSTKRVW